MSDLRIREAITRDVEGIIAIAIDAFWREYKSREEAERVFKSTVARRWKELIREKRGIVLVAEIGGQIVGFLIFRWWFGWNGWLEAIAVRSEYRGRGIGTQLMKTLIDRVRKLGYERVCFAIEQGSSVIDFYRKFNAVYFGELPDNEVGRLLLYYIPIQ